MVRRTLVPAMLAAAVLASIVRASEAEQRIEWLRQYCIELASIEPEDEDFSDLEPLRDLIGDARVVQLGEQSHGDGAVFLAKGRLIRFLHQRMGFDVLAFESGLYDCRKAWESLVAGTPALAAVEKGVFGIWTGSAQVRPVIDYLGAAATTDRPLELAGFDCQFTGSASREHLVDDLREFASAVEPPLYEDEDEWALLESTISWLVRWSVSAKALDRDSRMGALEELVRRLDRTGVDDAHPADEVAFWRQLARSMVGQARQVFDQQSSGRDEQMGENLVWLARQRYAGRRIIVWAATFHIMRNAPEIDWIGNPGGYDDTVTMGHVASQTLGDDCFTLGFIASEGKAGRFWDRPRDLGAASPGSLEALLAAAGFEYAILPLLGDREGDDWLHEGVVARPLGYASMRADWSRHIDAMLFTRVMTPSTRKREPRRPRQRLRISPEALAAASDLTARLDEAWREIEAEITSDGRLADQLDLTAVAGRWREVVAPDAGGLAGTRDEVTAWIERRRTGLDEELAPELVWRGEHLLAQLTTDAAARRRHLERALANLPERDSRRARPEDRMPQMTNELAFTVWESEGYDAALELAATTLATDRRLRLLDTDPWLARLTGEESAADRDRLIERIRAAYLARGERFPEFAAEARRFANRLR